MFMMCPTRLGSCQLVQREGTVLYISPWALLYGTSWHVDTPASVNGNLLKGPMM